VRFTSLGSGSGGNALVVERGRTRVMMDCGFGIAETKARLERVGLKPSISPASSSPTSTTITWAGSRPSP
jgi:hypothetical protein